MHTYMQTPYQVNIQQKCNYQVIINFITMLYHKDLNINIIKVTDVTVI